MGPDAGDRIALERRVHALKLSDVVTFCDPDFGKSPSEIIGAHHVVVAPSRFDGFNFSVLDAMLLGMPVVVTDAVGSASHVRAAGCGWIAQPTAESLANTITTALHDLDNWPVIGNLGRKYALATLSMAEVARKATHMYEFAAACGSHL
jgi:glycosyltransferase involved in cell wall biosynthesis